MSSQMQHRIYTANETDSYSSVEEWEAKNFPVSVKQQSEKRQEKTSEEIGIEIANKAFREVAVTFKS